MTDTVQDFLVLLSSFAPSFNKNGPIFPLKISKTVISTYLYYSNNYGYIVHTYSYECIIYAYKLPTIKHLTAWGKLHIGIEILKNLYCETM